MRAAHLHEPVRFRAGMLRAQKARGAWYSFVCVMVAVTAAATARKSAPSSTVEPRAKPSALLGSTDVRVKLKRSLSVNHECR